MLFHIVYGENTEIMMEFIHASTQRLYSLTEHQLLVDKVSLMLTNPTSVSLQQTRAMFFLLLNVDMPIKEYICNTQDRSLLAAALNIPLTDVKNKKSYVMTGAKNADAKKLESFFTRMHGEIIPMWMQNQALSCNDLVNTIKEEYIIS
jgi:hypothetical protein